MNALYYALLKSLEVREMENDPIVDEIRKYGQIFTDNYNNDISEICKVLRKKEKSNNQSVVNRSPRYTKHKTAS